jgi:hypothetical protein
VVEFTDRLTLIDVTPKARMISLCLTWPVTQNCLALMAMSVSAWLNTDMRR